MGLFLESPIQMADGSAKSIGDVQLGDQVSCGDGRVASVRNVVRYYLQTQMADCHGFKLTPKHAVRCPFAERSTDTWIYAREISTQVAYDKPTLLVDLELDEHHEIIGVHAEGTISCLTLGHAGWSDPHVRAGETRPDDHRDCPK